MKNFPKMLCLMLVLASCTQEASSPLETGTDSTALPANLLYHGEMVLGRQLENPYSVKNIEASLQDLYGTRAAGTIEANCRYVRFLPKDDEQYSRLLELGVDVFDHPLDREILRDGDYWHDPSLSEEEITWQYATVPSDFVCPDDIVHEVLEDCFIPDAATDTRGLEYVDWDSVEANSFRLTGNESLLEAVDPATKASKYYPSGRITIVDSGLEAGRRTVGVSGVKVLANTIVKVASAYTDAAGNYTMSTRFSSNPHYRLCFKNSKGFSIGFNLILVPASLSNLGKGSPEGLDATIEAGDGDALFRRCVVNNAAYDYYEKCDREGIIPPPSNLRFWILGSLKSSCSLMMHHGALIDIKLVTNYLDIYKTLIRVISPDITIGARNISQNYSALYSTASHELAHASHFQNVGTEYWNTLISYVLQSFLISGSCYGTGNGEYAGYCEISEMWAYYLERNIINQRYDSERAYPAYWFHPEILDGLEELGLTPSMILASMGRSVTDTDSFKSTLSTAYPSLKSSIQQLFKAWSR
ncbi:MAG: hypothetical protein ACI399_03855 [Candidatus Cryptobacteroides sp.]